MSYETKAIRVMAQEKGRCSVIDVSGGKNHDERTVEWF